MTSFHSSLSSEENMTNWQLNIDCRFLDGNTNTNVSASEPIPQCHGLSLSLGSELNQYTNLSFCSLLSSDIQSENNSLKNVKYLSFDLSGKTRDSVENVDANNFQNLISSNETSILPPLQQTPEYTGLFRDSKYLKAAQYLLDEVVSVRKALKQSEKGQKAETDVKKVGISAEFQGPTVNASRDLSPSERQDLQNKMTNLLAMLDEVDKWYKHYFHQMQALVSSFVSVAGPGSAQPYTALALQTISRQFRSLRDAIKKQIQDTGKKVGDDPISHGQGVLSRLRYVDQQLRQQKSLQQFGVMRQPWRPQRGLPETAVSVLRAWLFEHFLHPYPKESEKNVLAKQAGLSRSQVANWFINARVRLWKPMIENIYKEEFGGVETVSKTPPEYTPRNTREISAFDEREDEYQVILMSETTIDACRAELSHEVGCFQDSDVNLALTHYPNKKACNASRNGHFSDNDASSHDKTGNGNFIASTMVNQVSLALGLQNSEKDSQPNDPMASSMGLDNLECYVIDPMNNQHKFASSHMLSDFVA